MKALKTVRDNYVRWHAGRIKVPDFEASRVVRKNIVFSGKVQKVGFRLELFTLAERLELSGWVKNLENGSVEAELQGEEAKVDFLVEAMQSLKRATVTECDVAEVALNGKGEELAIIR